MLNRFRLISLALAAAAACVAAPASAETVQLHTQGSTGIRGYDPVGSVNAAGAAAVVWLNDVGATEEIAVRRRSADGSWSPVEHVGRPYPWNYSNPSVDVDQAGNVRVAWAMSPDLREPGTPNRTAGEVWVARAAAGQPFGPAERLAYDDNGSGQYRPQVRAASNGEVLALWTEVDGSVRYRVQSPSGTWGGERVVGATGPAENAEDAQLVTGPAGDAVLTWMSWISGQRTARVAVRRPGGAFSAPQSVGADPDVGVNALAAVSADGRAALAVTRHVTAYPDRAQLWTLAPGSAQFTRSADIPLPVSVPEAIALGSNGHGYVVGSFAGGYESDLEPRRFALPFSTGGVVGTPIAVSSAAEIGDQVFALYGDRDVLHVGWRRPHNLFSTAYDAEILSRSITPGGQISPAVSVGRRKGTLISIYRAAGGGPRPLLLFSGGAFGMGDVYAGQLDAPPLEATPPDAAPADPSTGGPSAPTAPDAQPTSGAEPAAAALAPPATSLLRSPDAAAPSPPAPRPASPVNAGCEIPAVSGLTLQAAKRRLARSQCRARVVRRVDRRRANRIAKQSPAYGSRPAGYVVRLVVTR